MSNTTVPANVAPVAPARAPEAPEPSKPWWRNWFLAWFVANGIAGGLVTAGVWAVTLLLLVTLSHTDYDAYATALEKSASAINGITRALSLVVWLCIRAYYDRPRFKYTPWWAALGYAVVALSTVFVKNFS